MVGWWPFRVRIWARPRLLWENPPKLDEPRSAFFVNWFEIRPRTTLNCKSWSVKRLWLPQPQIGVMPRFLSVARRLQTGSAWSIQLVHAISTRFSSNFTWSPPSAQAYFLSIIAMFSTRKNQIIYCTNFNELLLFFKSRLASHLILAHLQKPSKTLRDSQSIFEFSKIQPSFSISCATSSKAGSKGLPRLLWSRIYGRAQFQINWLVPKDVLTLGSDSNRIILFPLTSKERTTSSKPWTLTLKPKCWAATMLSCAKDAKRKSTLSSERVSALCPIIWSFISNALSLISIRCETQNLTTIASFLLTWTWNLTLAKELLVLLLILHLAILRTTNTTSKVFLCIEEALILDTIIPISKNGSLSVLQMIADGSNSTTTLFVCLTLIL